MEPSREWRETVTPGEDERFERYAEQLRAQQRRRARGRPADRALHAKGQLGLEAEFEVLPGLPVAARAGVFARPRTYRAYVRVSNGMGARQSDAKPDVRGIAIKVVGVAGKKLIPGMESARTQDFLMIRTPATPFRTADEFVWFVEAARQPALLPARAALAFGPWRTGQILARIVSDLAQPTLPVAAARYYSAAPIQCGEYAVRYGLVPLDEDVAKGRRRGGDFLREELAARLSEKPVAYDFRLQFFVDERRTPIEDFAREWREQDAPWVTVARLTLPRQDVESPRGRRVEEFVETLSFDPWHATADLRPLGNIMRARNAAYRLSTGERGAAAEPDGSETFEG